MVGRTISHYKVLTKRGEGGMGVTRFVVALPAFSWATAVFVLLSISCQIYDQHLAVEELTRLGARAGPFDGGYHVSFVPNATFRLSSNAELLHRIINLQGLNLEGTQVTDLTPLQSLTKLQDNLNLSGTDLLLVPM